ncbi:MAG: hypothetical protein HUU38_03930 [Anaerolineales bacterium]|nr:hypothetical protein [Anaerolineales bacterium]
MKKPAQSADIYVPKSHNSSSENQAGWYLIDFSTDVFQFFGRNFLEKRGERFPIFWPASVG